MHVHTTFTYRTSYPGKGHAGAPAPGLTEVTAAALRNTAHAIGSRLLRTVAPSSVLPATMPRRSLAGATFTAEVPCAQPTPTRTDGDGAAKTVVLHLRVVPRCPAAGPLGAAAGGGVSGDGAAWFVVHVRCAANGDPALLSDGAMLPFRDLRSCADAVRAAARVLQPSVVLS
jgi:hypothetical protein